VVFGEAPLGICLNPLLAAHFGARAGMMRHWSVALARAFKDAIAAAADTWKRDDRDQYQGREQ
jgi:hypothetical protein